MKTLGDRAAFPRTKFSPDDENQNGMSLRQHLTGQALAGLCASTGLYDARYHGGENNASIVTQIAEAAVAVADATLKELAKEGR